MNPDEFLKGEEFELQTADDFLGGEDFTIEEESEVAPVEQEQPQKNIIQIVDELAEQTGFKENIRQAQRDVDATFEKFRKVPTKTEKAAVVGQGVSRAVSDVVRAGLEPVGRVFGIGLQKVGESYSKLPGMEWLATRPMSEWTLDKVSEGFESLSKKSEELMQKHPDIAQDLKNLGEAMLLAVGAKPTERALTESAIATKEALGTGFGVTLRAGERVARTGGDILGTGLEKIKSPVKTFGEIKEGVKSKLTGVPVATGEQKILDDSLNIARERITSDYEIQAAKEGRTFTEGRTKQVKFKPTRREQLLADSIEQLVRDGRVKSDALPFENIPPILQEVSRINSGVEQMLFENKIPFNTNQLRKKLFDVQKESEIVFTTDPTLKRTYNSLIEAFVNEVKTKDTLGLFQARQSFDKIPAVKKLLDGIKGAEGENLRRQAVLDIRRAVNEYISDQLPTNNPYKPLLKQESYMLSVIENLADKSQGLGGTNVITRFLDENPMIKKTVGPFILGGIAF